MAIMSLIFTPCFYQSWAAADSPGATLLRIVTEKYLELNPHYFIYFLPDLGIFSIIKTYFLNTKQGPVLPASECDTGFKKSLMVRSLMTSKKKIIRVLL